MAKILTHSTAPLFTFNGNISSISRCDNNGNCYIATYDVTPGGLNLYIYKFNIFTKSTELINNKSGIGQSNKTYNNVLIQLFNNSLHFIIKKSLSSTNWNLYYLHYDLDTNTFGDLRTIRTYTNMIEQPIGNLAINKDGTELYMAYPSLAIIAKLTQQLARYVIRDNSLIFINPNGYEFLTNTSPDEYSLLYANNGGSGVTLASITYIFSDPLNIIYKKTSYSPSYYIQIPNTSYYIGDSSYGLLDEKYDALPIGNITSTYIPCVLDDDYVVTIDTTNSLYNIFVFQEYDIDFTFKTNSDDIVLTDKAPISKINLSITNNVVGASISFLNGDVSYISYEIDIPDNKRFIGLSTNPLSTTPTIILGETTIEIDGDTTFYPVFITYKPPTRTFQLDLYKNSAEPNRVDKTDYITQIGTLHGAFREETSITNMTIIIEQEEFPQFNYVYIPIFGRYYYVTDIISIRQNLWEISLSVDVLMSYKYAILNLNAFIDRNENASNPMLIDKKRVIEQGVDVEVIEIENDVFFKDIETFQPDTDLMFVINGYKIDSADTLAT